MVGVVKTVVDGLVLVVLPMGVVVSGKEVVFEVEVLIVVCGVVAEATDETVVVVVSGDEVV